MYQTDEGYRDMVTSFDRTVDIYMSMGVNIDNTAADDLSDVTGVLLPMSNKGQLTNARYQIQPGLATYEADGIPTSDSAGSVVPPLVGISEVETSIWSSSISDSVGNISVSIEVELSSVHTSAFTVYTDGPNILAGSVTFKNGNDSETASLVCHEGYAVVSGSHSFDAVTIAITSIDAAYKHLRIVEIEFGDSITIGLDDLAGEVTYIEEVDPLQVGLPMCELDFNLTNVDGMYDEDKPNTRYTQLAIGNPIMLSFTVSDGETRTTIPVGRFVIGEKKATELRMAVVAYDVRWLLSQTYIPWTITPSEDLGTTLYNLLTGLDLACSVEESARAVYPQDSYTFSPDSTVLDDIQLVAQAYGISILPDRYGTLIIGTEFASDDYGDMESDNQYSWPLTSQMKKYNYIDVGYGLSQHYTRDLRSNPNTARSTLSIYNGLIVDENMAIDVCDRIASYIYTTAVKVDWFGDPALSIYDAVNVPSRWSSSEFKALKRTMTYGGSLRETTTFVQ